MAARWEDWEVPPFRYYISQEDQELTVQACDTLTYLTNRVLVPAAAHIGLLLDTLAERKFLASMVRVES